MKTTNVKLNVPSKVLSLSIKSISPFRYWPHDSGDGDPWWQRGPSPRPYQWRLTANVKPYRHGSHLTRDDFEYNGLDVNVGDWIAGSSSGICVKVISVESKTNSEIDLIVEDYLRYNTFRQPNGVGIFGVGLAVLFTLNPKGEPLLDPLPVGIMNETFYSTVNSRFKYMSAQDILVLEQEGHGFAQGDVIAVTSTSFVQANASTYDQIIGRVKYVGPGPDQFILEPTNEVVDYDNDIPGNPGDVVYFDDSGNLTLTESSRPAYLVVKSAVASEAVGSEKDPNIEIGTPITINGERFEVSGNADSLAATINVHTANTGVVANVIPSPTTGISNTAQLAYGMVGGYTNFRANINGHTVDFTTNRVGQDSFNRPVALAEDMATDINSANIANITAEAIGGKLVIEHSAGANIVISNRINDFQGTPFAGANSVSGLDTEYFNDGSQLIKLTRSDGGDILIYDPTERFTRATGIRSSQTGQYPIAIDIQQGLRSATNTVVADITARDNLSPGVGDQAYVLDAGEGKWALYLWDGSAWAEVSNQDLAEVDAKTISTTFDLPVSGAVSFSNLGEIPSGAKVISVSIDVEDYVIGGSNTPALHVGSDSDTDLLVGPDVSDLSAIGTYVAYPEYFNQTGNDLMIRARLDHFGAGAGRVNVRVSYV